MAGINLQMTLLYADYRGPDCIGGRCPLGDALLQHCVNNRAYKGCPCPLVEDEASGDIDAMVGLCSTRCTCRLVPLFNSSASHLSPSKNLLAGHCKWQRHCKFKGHLWLCVC